MLKGVINEPIIKKRYILLSDYLKQNSIGSINNDIIHFKNIFSKFYIPDDNEDKFDVSDITDVKIIYDKWKNKCFSICVNNVWYPTSIKRLSGSGKRNNNDNLLRALRNAIKEQIYDFKKNNKLNIDNICPITGDKLNTDAEVDHEIPFNILAKEWINNNSNIEYYYDINEMNYTLDNKFLKKWQDYHYKNAKLRWVTKKGNQFAHKLYNPIS